MKIAVVVPTMHNGERGGAENLYEGLVEAMREAGHKTSMIKVPVDESSFEKILEAYCQCFYLDLDEYDLVISTKAPTYMVRHRNHISYLLHTIRVFYDMFESEMNARDPMILKQRKIILEMDKYGLSPERVKKHFVNGTPVYKRMIEADKYWESVMFKALHHPPKIRQFKEPKEGEFILFPGRLHHWKRPELVIAAMKYIKHNVKLLIIGEGEDEARLKEIAKGDDRIQFLGRVDDDKLIDLYSHAITVPFVPINEDYGLVTIEAFRSKKPVITCTDSGEPAAIVKDGINGFIVEPDPKKLAEKLDYLIGHPEESRKMGEAGYNSVRDITWNSVVSTLLEGILVEHGSPEIKVLVTDMQPIEPPVGGGRLRLKGLYSRLAGNIYCSYVGTYDWKGEKNRKIKISDRLTETTIPLSDEHFKLNEYLTGLVPGKTIIDVDFPLLVDSSPTYINAVCNEAIASDVVIFSHPWLYPAVSTRVDLKNKIVIYDSHNVEYLLREKLLGREPFAGCLSQMVRFVEKELCEKADLILACSEEDRNLFIQNYHVIVDKVKIYPNGVDTDDIKPVTEETRKLNKSHYGISGRAAIFIGSNYNPNIEAGEFIIRELAPKCNDVLFIISGGVGTSLNAGELKNVMITGVISEEDKIKLLAASDIAINPMFGGSGTNIKMFDYLSAGLPTISTPVGARGIQNTDAFIVSEGRVFSDAIRHVLSDEALYDKLSSNGRLLVEQHYDWNLISGSLGLEINRLFREKSPFFSVVVPTYRDEKYIHKLFEKIGRQTFRSFELIVVDSGEDHEDKYRLICNFNLRYFHRPGLGAARARNVGIDAARGKYIAFTDDDCQPDEDWLENAKKKLDKENLVGLEGYIYTDESKLKDPNYRIVTNKGFEELGFMTANLFIKRDILIKIGGFDERFDKPHFREDTELAWRAIQYGWIKYASDVRVFHPPLPRELKGESKNNRDYFFVNDALLFSMYPERYIRLMKAEGHYKNNPNYWKYFQEGIRVMNLKVPMKYLMDDNEISQYVPAELKSFLEVSL
jgi:glycosyltransferase involved in cell wall biosynthesis